VKVRRKEKALCIRTKEKQVPGGDKGTWEKEKILYPFCEETRVENESDASSVILWPPHEERTAYADQKEREWNEQVAQREEER